MAPLTRRKFLRVTAGAAGAGALAVSAYASLVEPNHPRLVGLEIPLTRLPEAFDGFTIAQLSDFHYNPYLPITPIRVAIDMVNQLTPDLIVLTGDFVTIPIAASHFNGRHRAALDAEPCAQLLSQLRARVGRFSVLGNHDVGSDRHIVAEILNSHGLPVLHNRSVPLERAGARIWLCGLDDYLDGDPDIEAALRGLPENEAVVMLIHEPDAADDMKGYPVDLQLSGHSHGGQIWIPGFGAPWLPPLARKYPRGLRQLGPLMLYTNLGLGTIRLPIRLNCPPEVTLITLRAARS